MPHQRRDSNVVHEVDTTLGPFLVHGTSQRPVRRCPHVVRLIGIVDVRVDVADQLPNTVRAFFADGLFSGLGCAPGVGLVDDFVPELLALAQFRGVHARVIVEPLDQLCILGALRLLPGCELA
jgi:hypothetical protein